MAFGVGGEEGVEADVEDGGDPEGQELGEKGSCEFNGLGRIRLHEVSPSFLHSRGIGVEECAGW